MPGYSADVSSSSEPSFGYIRMRGGRYDQHGLPLDAAPELQRYENLIVRVARAIYMRQHRNRKRAPRGFSNSVILRLTAIEEGSVVPILHRDDALSQAYLMPLADYFEQARVLVNDTFKELNVSNSLNSAFPVECIKDLAAFGRSLRPDEYFEFSDTGSNPSTFRIETRKRLQEIANLERIDVETVVIGQVTGLRSTPQQFDFVLPDSNKRITGTYIDHQMYEELHTFQGYMDRAPMVALTVIAAQSLDGEILSISDVLAVEAALPLDWGERIRRLAALEDGWLHADSLAPTDTAIDRAEHILLACLDEGVPRPGIFPTETGGVQLEWPSETTELEVSISATGSVSALWFSKEDDEQERDESFGADSPVDDILTFIQGGQND